MEDWRMKIANDPDSPPWWAWVIMAAGLYAIVIIFG